MPLSVRQNAQTAAQTCNRFHGAGWERPRAGPKSTGHHRELLSKTAHSTVGSLLTQGAKLGSRRGARRSARPTSQFVAYSSRLRQRRKSAARHALTLHWWCGWSDGLENSDRTIYRNRKNQRRGTGSLRGPIPSSLPSVHGTEALDIAKRVVGRSRILARSAVSA